jgi:hypothetical protein
MKHKCRLEKYCARSAVSNIECKDLSHKEPLLDGYVALYKRNEKSKEKKPEEEKK